MRDLYQEKINILREVLELTQSVGFKGNDGDADQYISLIARRETLFGRAKEIDKELAEIQNTPETEPYARELGALARQIIEQDNYMKATVLKIQDDTKADIKNINTGKNLNSLYSTQTDPDAAGRDWSQ